MQSQSGQLIDDMVEDPILKVPKLVPYNGPPPPLDQKRPSLKEQELAKKKQKRIDEENIDARNFRLTQPALPSRVCELAPPPLMR